MNYLEPRLLSALAGEYALGTMSQRVRRRFERVVASDASARAELARWQDRLQPLAERIVPIEPAPRVWQRIEERIAGRESQRALPVAVGIGDVVSVWWRRIALVSTALASVLLVVMMMRPDVMRTEQPSPMAAGPKKWDTWAVLMSQGPKPEPQMIVCADAASKRLWVMVSNRQQVAADRSLELWVVPKSGAPRSLGVIPSEGVLALDLPVTVREKTGDAAAFAVSLEPAGGSKTGSPTQVLYVGALTRST